MMFLSNKQKEIKFIIFCIYAISLAGIFLVSSNTVSAADSEEKIWVIPQPRITIPSMEPMATPTDCTVDANGKEQCSSKWISQYVAGIYKYAVSVVGILAVVVMMFGGVRWIVAGGNASSIGDAKAWIASSVTGLILVLTSYMILYTINPSLVSYKPLSLQEVEEMEPEYFPSEDPDTNVAIAAGTGNYKTLSNVKIPQFSADKLNKVAEKYKFVVTSGVRDQSTQVAMTGNKWACQCKTAGCSNCPHVAGIAVDVYPLDSNGNQLATQAQCKADMSMCHKKFADFQAEMKKNGLCVIQKEAWHYEKCK